MRLRLPKARPNGSEHRSSPMGDWKSRLPHRFRLVSGSEHRSSQMGDWKQRLQAEGLLSSLVGTPL